jgi:hypothetical protein
MKKELITNKIKFASINTKEDYVLWLKITLNNKKIFALKNNLTKWRKLNDSLSASKIQKLYDGYLVYRKYMNLSLAKSFIRLLLLSFNYGLNFTYNQKELALFYNSYADLMKFWDNKIHNFVYTVQYEKLVAEPDENIKNILDFCDLSFEKNCLEFHENKSPVRTVSASQVREKIYKNSIHSYKMFEKNLGDIFNNLAE